MIAWTMKMLFKLAPLQITQAIFVSVCHCCAVKRQHHIAHPCLQICLQLASLLFS